eukprot:CAMPEP_0115088842 /NCGR_PEP_ID=MMETSP0227-20121206/24261_1 /TAXON_ID=89957 /ORGANISM="Polarella glacialis, Strain CCMP 1383" /LENGTH=183 /DNA_ID=CAMNT_0002479247 /DNA_START=72 /DNA_END=620 /DNA_ORIENTATION=+
MAPSLLQLWPCLVVLSSAWPTAPPGQVGSTMAVGESSDLQVDACGLPGGQGQQCPVEVRSAGTSFIQLPHGRIAMALSMARSTEIGCSGPLRWSTHSDKCVDVAAGNTAVGTNIQLWYCDNDAEHPNMQFTPPPPGSQGLIRWTTNVNKCLEVAGGSTKEGTNIQLGDCDGSKTSMLFTMPSG